MILHGNPYHLPSMFRFFCKKLLQPKTKDSKCIHIWFLQSTSSSKSFSGVSGSANQQSPTVSYLINSCGLSLEAATSAAEKIRIETTEKPDSVIELLKTHGFTKTQIANLITKYPRMLLSNPVKTLKPKIDYFESLGISRRDLPKILCSDTTILLSSLKKQIIPTLDFLRSFIHTNENLVTAVKQSTRVVRCNIQKVMQPNIATLRSHGVPDSSISKLITLQPRSLMMDITLFKEVVERIEKMGFDPTSRSFILAVRSMWMSKLNWERKRQVFKSFGWSEEDFLLAFKVQPTFMLTSEKKLMQLMDFFENKLGLKPSDVVKCPNLFLTSLEGRIIPRCLVLQVLMSKGLIEKDVNVVWVLNSTKERFEQKFVIKYQEIAPEVITAYQGEMPFLGFNDVSGIKKLKEY